MTKTMDELTNTFETAMKPVTEFSEFMMKSGETALSKQVECYKAYTKIGMDNMNEGLQVRNFEDMMAYSEKQKDIAKKATDLFVEDAKTFTELNTKFVEEVRSIFETNIKNSVEAVKAAT